MSQASMFDWQWSAGVEGARTMMKVGSYSQLGGFDATNGGSYGQLRAADSQDGSNYGQQMFRVSVLINAAALG